MLLPKSLVYLLYHLSPTFYKVLRKQRKEAASLHARLYALWDLYQNGRLKSFVLLEKCAELYHDCKQDVSTAVRITKPADPSTESLNRNNFVCLLVSVVGLMARLL